MSISGLAWEEGSAQIEAAGHAAPMPLRPSLMPARPSQLAVGARREFRWGKSCGTQPAKCLHREQGSGFYNCLLNSLVVRKVALGAIQLFWGDVVSEL
jgi:hypothetical protein